MNTPLSLRSCRLALLAALACGAIPLVASVVHGYPTASMSGDPAPPVQAAVGVPYNVTASATPDAGQSICVVRTFSSRGGTGGPGSDWIEHGYYSDFSDTTDVTKRHTFNVVNQSYGYYYWKPECDEYDPNTEKYTQNQWDVTGSAGYFYTPYGG